MRFWAKKWGSQVVNKWISEKHMDLRSGLLVAIDTNLTQIQVWPSCLMRFLAQHSRSNRAINKVALPELSATVIQSKKEVNNNLLSKRDLWNGQGRIWTADTRIYSPTSACKCLLSQVLQPQNRLFLRVTSEWQVGNKSIASCHHVTTDPLSDPLLASQSNFFA